MVREKGAREAVEEEKVKEKMPRQPSTIMWKVSPQLAAAVGSDEATFDAIRASVNKYIKDHNLQVKKLRQERALQLCMATSKLMPQKEYVQTR